MPERKLTSEELGLMSLFQNLSGATARDCIIDGRMNRVIFLIERGQMGLAIGKNGEKVKLVERLIGKPVEVVEYSEEPKELIKNALNPSYINEIRIVEKLDGGKVAVVVVDHRRKGAVVGREGKNAERARLLAKRYFAINNVNIISS